MRKILVTGGTTFVSRYVAKYFVEKNNQVYVLNRNSKTQEDGVILIEADRHSLKEQLKYISFDVVIDVTSYDKEDIQDLSKALGDVGQYIMISSSAVYKETNLQPFLEESSLGNNIFWGDYGTNKIKAEKLLQELFPDAYILRPPYLYGPMNNVYREAFVFECAGLDRPFYIPKDGSMKLQFFYIEDLCRIIEKMITTSPSEHVMNVGNTESISIKQWVELCYQCVGKRPKFVNVYEDINPREYFSFYEYEYALNVERQNQLLDSLTPMEVGLQKSYEWYCSNYWDVKRKDFIEYIDHNLLK